MDKKASLILGAGTVVTAVAIGAVMQYGWDFRGPSALSATQPLQVAALKDVQDVSSSPKEFLPKDRIIHASLPSNPVGNPAPTVAPDTVDVPADVANDGFSCEVSIEATPAAGALMQVSLTAPCHGSERVTLHHHGLMFTEVVQPDGTLTVSVPALTENAVVMASFMDGSGAVGTTTVTSVPFYDRIVLQWRGDAGLQLHAREFDAQYFSEGHVWQGAQADPSRAAAGNGGFMTKLGDADSPDALLAEIYTYPSGTSGRSGIVELTVEAQITQDNCGHAVDAQTLEMRDSGELRARDLSIEVPGCEAAGDFLLLKNIVKDLTIAAR